MNRRQLNSTEINPFLSRRRALQSDGAGFGYLALAGILGQTSPAKAADPAGTSAAHRPLEPKSPHVRIRAKRIIFLYMEGAISQMDTWEYKPQLQKDGDRPGPGGG